jgi:hypothetical protein
MIGIDIDGMAAAMKQLTQALAELEVELVSPFWAAFATAYRTAASPSQLRRWQRDLDRANRRPSLIHNGRKAR